jgi:glycosyltransferase involved in cell wall biosynthesis
MDPLVSILIPAYNAERSLGDTLRSALAQSWTRTEVIVVDDGSTDGTSRIAESFASPAVKVVRQENQGASAARNHALGLAQGEYLQWLDADDLLSRDKVMNQVALLRDGDPRVLASCGWAYFRRRPRAATFAPGPLWSDLEPVEWLLRKWESNTFMQTSTWLTSRVLADAAGPWNTTLGNDDDGEYFARVIAHCTRIRFAHDARVYYRVSASAGLSYLGGSAVKLDAMYRGMKLQMDLVRQLRDDDRTRSACRTYIETWLPEFEGQPALVHRMRQLASEFGVEVEMPPLGRKYQWMAALIGRERTRRIQRRYNVHKAQLLEAGDRLRAAMAGPDNPATL